MTDAHKGTTYIVMAAAAKASLARCRECGVRMLWFVTDAGARMPLDIESATPVDGGRIECVPHFATCPKADRFRKRKAEPKKPCPAENCEGTVLSDELLCHDCWSLVPKRLRDEVRRTWKLCSQNAGARALWKSYEGAAAAAINDVNAKKANRKVRQIDAFGNQTPDPG